MSMVPISQLLPSIPEMSQAPGSIGESSGGREFLEILKNHVNEVDRLLIESDQKVQELATGKAENLHDAMIAFEKAETAFKLLTQVRNKAINAYNEIMKMQV